MSDGEAEEGNQPEPERIEAIGGDDGNAARSLHQDDLQEPEGEEEEREHARKHEQERAARSVKTSPKPALETMFMELPPVLEIDEEVRTLSRICFAYPCSQKPSECSHCSAYFRAHVNAGLE